MGVFNVALERLAGAAFDESALSGKAVLVVNVVSRCGLTPQYVGLERLHRTFGATSRFAVLGIPCNQFHE
jgi:glutathione peroxidase